MGFFDRFFGAGASYPPLDDSNPAARQMEALMPDIESIADEVQVPIEVVPAEGAAYVFVGKPPKKFGMFWVEDGRIKHLKQLADEKGIGPERLSILSEHLRQAYIKSKSEPRFYAETAKGKVTVTPSQSLLSEVRKVIQLDL